MHGKYPRTAKITERTYELLEKDERYISPSYTRDFEFVVASGRGREVIDIEGNYYLDFGAGIAVTSTGHCHPEVVRAIIKQTEKLIHMSGTDFYYEPQIKLAEALSKMVTGRYEEDYMCFFGNSGAEAVEAAMKLARYCTQRPAFIAFTGAFHGRTLGALSLTGSKAVQRRWYQPLQPVVHAPYANCKECLFGSTAKACTKNGFKCLEYLKNEIFTRTMPPEDVAAIFVEAQQGEGGYIVPPDGWLEELDNIAHSNDILFVIDEIQSGIGRTGRWFAHQHYAIEPDIITMAKGIASGMPISAMLARATLMEEWEPGSHASTFGGNPIACAAALKTLEVIDKENLMVNAVKRGQQLHKELVELQDAHECIKHPRGMGLMRAVDIETNGKGLNRDTVIKECFAMGLILLGCGKNGIRFCPALNVTKEEIATCVSLLEKAINECSRR